MPAGVTAKEVVIGPETHCATIVLTAAANAAATSATIRVVGTSQVGGANAQRVARFAERARRRHHGHRAPAGIKGAAGARRWRDRGGLIHASRAGRVTVTG